MPSLTLTSTQTANQQYRELRQRAVAVGQLDQFNTIHTEILGDLCNLDKAIERGERLYLTRKPGGEVRQWVHRFISVTYVVFPNELTGWIIKYASVPSSWPE